MKPIAVADGNVIIIDRSTVITGSFNFSNEAENRNAENLMIVRSGRLAAAYIENWELHRGHAVVFKQAAAPQPPQKEKSEKKPVKQKKKKPKQKAPNQGT
jgi:phosphatidylserine/phosphatidylglycerophosphate/cardiolipin synthase-like enzyme